MTPTSAPRADGDDRLHRKRDTLAVNLTYAEQRALEIGITIAGGASVILLDEPTPA
jgi:branched-chain amino acid transport system ATP-binding protein